MNSTALARPDAKSTANSKTAPYTLKHYFTAAKLTSIPDWAEQIVMPSVSYLHQVGDLNHLALYSRSGLYSDPGVGKTRSMQAYGLWLAAQQNKTVYLMPPILIPQFMASLHATFPGYAEFVSSYALQETPVKREQLIRAWQDTAWPQLLVMSYRMFVGYRQTLTEVGYNAVIVDEATAIKSPTSQIHQAVLAFAGDPGPNSNGVVLATGTPLENAVMDCYGFIALLEPSRYGSQKAFERWHVVLAPQSVSKYPIITGYKNLDYLHRALFNRGRRITKAQALDLPDKVIHEIPIRLSVGHMKLYRTLIERGLAELNGERLDMTEQAALRMALQQALINPEQYTDRPPKNHVTEALAETINALQGRKVIVFCWFQHSIEKLRAEYRHLYPAVLYGKTTTYQRDTEKQRFIQDPECQLLIANFKSAGLGIDGLQTVCSHIVFAEVCPIPGLFQQAIDRLHRVGQQQKVTIYLLVPLNTVAVNLRNALLMKDYQQEAVIKDKRAVLQDLIGGEGLRGRFD